MHIRDIGEILQQSIATFSQSLNFLRDIPGWASRDYQCEEWRWVGLVEDVFVGWINEQNNETVHQVAFLNARVMTDYSLF